MSAEDDQVIATPTETIGKRVRRTKEASIESSRIGVIVASVICVTLFGLLFLCLFTTSKEKT